MVQPAQPSIDVVLVCAYAVVLLVVAVVFDRLGARSALRSASWRTGNFLYHGDADAWTCHEDQWLWPASFDPDKRVIRYSGQHAICGRCPAKAECSPTPGPRELTRQVDPWPHSEAGRFHRGVSLAVACVALMMVLVTLLFGARGAADVVLLSTALALVVAVGVPLARHLWNTPDGFPGQLRLDRGDDPARGSDGASVSSDKGGSDGSGGSDGRNDRRDSVPLGMPVRLSANEIDAALARHRTQARPDPNPRPRYASDRRPS